MNKSRCFRFIGIVALLFIVSISIGCSHSKHSTKTHKISGTVSAQDVIITITLNGTSVGTTTTDASGNYSITGLKNGTYTVTPSLSGHTFDPASHDVTINGADVTADFAMLFAIAGTVSGPVWSLVTITLTDTTTSEETKTSTNMTGDYSFTGLKSGTFNVTPSYPYNNTTSFDPTTLVVTISNANQPGIDFTSSSVTAEELISISGTVKMIDGTPSSGVTMTLSGKSTGSVLTDENGNYTFNNLANGSFIITPSLSGYNFSPSSSTQTVSGANIPNVNFTAITSSTPIYKISGNVTLQSDGSPLEGVTMSAGSQSTTTDKSGNYILTGLANGKYTITPSKSSYFFTPLSSDQELNGADIKGVTFTATPLEIRGTVVDVTGLTVPPYPYLAGVTMTLSHRGGGFITTMTSVDHVIGPNVYFFNITNGDYTVTPSLAGYTFSPASQDVTIYNNTGAVYFYATHN